MDTTEGYSERYVTTMNDFLDYSVFRRWRELLEENNFEYWHLIIARTRVTVYDISIDE